MITQQNGKWYLYSKDGSKKLGGPYNSHKQALKREQVQYFKHIKQASFIKEALSNDLLERAFYKAMKRYKKATTIADKAKYKKQLNIFFQRQTNNIDKSFKKLEKKVYTDPLLVPFIKKALAVDFSGHFWDQAFGRPKVQKTIHDTKLLLEHIGGGDDKYIEDIPELKSILNFKNKRFLYQKTPTSPKYILGLQKTPSGKHKLVVVTGLLPEHVSYNLINITPQINILSTR